MEAYDNKTELIENSYPMPGITGVKIKELIHVDESQMPLELGPYLIPTEDVYKFSEYIAGEFEVDSRCDYFVGLYRDY